VTAARAIYAAHRAGHSWLQAGDGSRFPSAIPAISALT